MPRMCQARAERAAACRPPASRWDGPVEEPVEARHLLEAPDRSSALGLQRPGEHPQIQASCSPPLVGVEQHRSKPDFPTGDHQGRDHRHQGRGRHQQHRGQRQTLGRIGSGITGKARELADHGMCRYPVDASTASAIPQPPGPFATTDLRTPTGVCASIGT